MRWSTEERFWLRVDIKRASVCWPWSGPPQKSGYGIFNTGAHGPMKPARFAFYSHNGYFAEVTRHTCHNPPCCNPWHLQDGTGNDNVQDMIQAGRHRNQRKAQCKCGREYDTVKRRGNGKTFRACSHCALASLHRRRGPEKTRHSGPKRYIVAPKFETEYDDV